MRRELPETLAETVERWKRGDMDAAANVLAQFAARARGIAGSGLSDASLREDAVQEAYCIALRRIGSLRDPQAFEAWFANVARSATRNVRNRSRTLPVADDCIFERNSGSPGDSVLSEEFRQKVEEAIRRLPSATREAAEPFFLDDLDYGDLAERLGKPLGTVKRRIHEGRRRLRWMLRGYLADSERHRGLQVGHEDEVENAEGDR